VSVTNEIADASQLSVDTVTHPSSVWILLRGEADIATAAELRTALNSVQLARHQSLHLHVGDLGYADVGTLCQLALFARRARRAGHTVMTCRANPTMRRVAEHLGIHDELGVLPASPSLPAAP
jgi:anti-anti-sigma factor